MTEPAVNTRIDNENRISAKISGGREAAGAVEFDDFVQLCQAIEECLKCTEAAVTGAKPVLRYRIVKLRTGSAEIAIEPIAPLEGRDRRRQTVGLFNKTITALQHGRRVDSRYGDDDLNCFRRLIIPLERGAATLEVSGQVLTTEFATNIEKALGETFSSEGSITGIIEGLNVHNRFECTIYEQVDAQRISCSFPKELVDIVLSAIRKRVTIFGLQSFRPDSAIPYQVRIESIEVLPPDEELPTLDDVRELGTWDTGGKSAVDFVRSLRDGDG
jgi:hypothetical protein